MRAFLFAGQPLTADDERFREALAIAHARAHDPFACARRWRRDVCGAPRERLHAQANAWYGPAACTRLPVEGSAHLPTALRAPPVGDREDHSTSLKVSFSLTKRGPPSTAPHNIHSKAESASQRTGTVACCLPALLVARSRARPLAAAFAGRRSWATVRRASSGCQPGQDIGRPPLSDLLLHPGGVFVSTVERSASAAGSVGALPEVSRARLAAHGAHR
jgi:hypothetical protein